MIKVFEAFAGIGTQRMALERLGIEHEVVAISEIDKHAVKSYEAIHGPVNNLGDITRIEVEDIPEHDLFTYSFPCQDISVAGKGLGLDIGDGTRSGLLWECQKVIAGKKPKYLLLENVKNLVGKRHKHNFELWLDWLSEQGYKNYWQVLNAKDYGIPQNRERVFCISILNDTQGYEFPKPIDLELRLKDLLEDKVDDKYFLSDKNLKMLLKDDTGKYPRKARFLQNINKNTDIANTIQTRQRTSPTDNYIKIKNATKKGYIEAENGDGIDLAFPNSSTRRGRVQKQMSQTLDTGDAKGVLIGASRGRNPKNPSDRTVGVKTEQRLEINKNGTSNTLTSVQKDNLVVYRDYRIRKLTPLECWRLMGIHDSAFDKARASGVSEAQLYKQAGNAIVVDVLEAIFRNLFSKKAEQRIRDELKEIEQ